MDSYIFFSIKKKFLIILFIVVILFTINSLIILNINVYNTDTFTNEMITNLSFQNILKNNLSLFFQLTLFSLISIGFLGLIFFEFNLFLLCSNIITGFRSYGIKFLYFLIPHGILEFLALIFCILFIIESIFSIIFLLKNKNIPKFIIENIKTHFICTIISFIISAAIESTISVNLLERYIL